MTDQDEELIGLGKHFLESLFRAAVERCDIEVEGRTFEEIRGSFTQALAAVRGSGPTAYEATPTMDYREILLEKAMAEAKSGHLEISVTLYATWLEHTVNGVLEVAFERKGFSHASYLSIIRELRFATKLRALWEVVGLPALPDEKLRVIDHAIGLRNSFVHYKWPAYDEAGHDGRAEEFRRAISEFESLASEFDEIENMYFWHGRRDELLAAFREDIDEGFAQRPFRLGD